MKRKFTFMILAMLFAILGPGAKAWGQTKAEKSIEINTTNSGVTGSYADKTFDVDDVTFGFTQWMKNNNIQAKKSTTNSLYNVDAIPGNIKSITFVQTQTARAIKVYGGTATKPTTEITAPTTAATMTFDFSGKEYTYFSMTTPGNACYFDKITITYEDGTTPSKELVSLAVSGTPTKTTYEAGEEFDPAGLTVTGTYSDASQEVITSGITWDVTPNPLTAGITSVSVTATVDEIESEPFEVTGLTVNEFVQTYANTYTSDASLSSVITGSKVKWEGCKEPNGYNALKIGKGGTATITVPAGTKTVHLHMVAWNGESDAVTVKLGSTTLPSITPTADAGVSGSSTTYTIATEPETENSYYFPIEVNTDEEATLSLTTASSKRAILFGVNFEADTEPSITADVEEIEFEQKELDGTATDSKTISATGKNLTAAIAASMKSGSAAVFSVTPVGAPTAAAGEFTVSYSTTEAGEYAGTVVLSSGETSIEIPVSASVVAHIPVLQSVAVSGTPDKTEYTEGDAFETAGLVVTGTYDVGAPQTITEGIEWTVTPSGALTAGTTSVSVTATVGTVISETYVVDGLTVTEFVQTYANTYTSNIELTTTSGTSASTAKVKWENKEYDALKCGTSNATGKCVVTIPANTQTLHFHAAGWNGETVVLNETINLVADAGVSGNSPFTLKNDPETQDYFTLNPDGATSITFSATSGKRFVLFGVNAESAPVAVEAPTFSVPAGNYMEAQSVELSCATEGASIYYTTDGTEPSAESTPYESAISVNKSMTIKAIAIKGEENSSVATAAYKITTYANLADLVADGDPGTDGYPVTVTLTDEVITKFYESTSTPGQHNGIYLMAGDKEIEIYCINVHNEWVLGGTVSGTLKNCTWKNYKGTWELCPTDWSGLTYNAPTTYNITIADGILNGTVEADMATAAAGVEVTLTVTPDEGYKLATLTVKDATESDVTVTDNKFTMPESNVTVSATFEEIPTYAAKFFVNDVQYGETQNVYEGADVVFPTDPAAIGAMSFVGWTASAMSGVSDKAPEFVTSATMGTEDLNFYAVFATKQEGDGNYEKVTTTEDLANGKYLIVYETGNVALDGKLTADAASNTVAVTISNSIITSSDEIDAAAVTFNATDGSFLGGGGSGKYIGHTGSSNSLNYSDSPLANVVTFDNGDVVITAGDYVMRYNDASNQNRFRYYKSGQKAIQLYKKHEATYSNFCTTVKLIETDTTVDGDITWEGNYTINEHTVTIGSGAVLTVNGALINTDPENLIIEDGGQLIHNNAGTVATMKKNITGYTGTNDHYYFIANPTDETTVANLTESNFDLYTFSPAGDGEGREWINMKSSPVVANDGTGYLYANSGEVTLGFAGKLVPAGSTDKSLVYAEEGSGIDFPGFNLIGNPYACNAYVLYEEEGMSTYRLNAGGSELIAVEAGTPIAPCEGFFVEAEEVGQTVTITTEEPEVRPSALSLTVSQNRGSVIDRAIISFNGSANLHKFMLNPSHTNLSIAKDGETFAAVSSETRGELPVSFKAETTGTYTISVNTDNVTAGYIHLIDNMTGADVDLLATPSYSFIGSPRDNENRFTVKFEVSLGQSQSDSEHFVYQNGSELVINGEGTLQIFDVLGRVVISEEVHGQTVNIGGLNTGAYIVRLTGESVKTQKIVVR